MITYDLFGMHVCVCVQYNSLKVYLLNFYLNFNPIRIDCIDENKNKYNFNGQKKKEEKLFDLWQKARDSYEWKKIYDIKSISETYTRTV